MYMFICLHVCIFICIMLQHTAVLCNTLQRAAAHFVFPHFLRMLQRVEYLQGTRWISYERVESCNTFFFFFQLPQNTAKGQRFLRWRRKFQMKQFSHNFFSFFPLTSPGCCKGRGTYGGGGEFRDAHNAPKNIWAGQGHFYEWNEGACISFPPPRSWSGWLFFLGILYCVQSTAKFLSKARKFSWAKCSCVHFCIFVPNPHEVNFVTSITLKNVSQQGKARANQSGDFFLWAKCRFFSPLLLKYLKRGKSIAMIKSHVWVSFFSPSQLHVYS